MRCILQHISNFVSKFKMKSQAVHKYRDVVNIGFLPLVFWFSIIK